MTAQTLHRNPSVTLSPHFTKQLRRFTAASLMTLFATIVLLAYLSPFAYMMVTSLKTKDQIVASATGPILPVEPRTIEYNGEQVEILHVPLEDGTVRLLAIIDKGRNESAFIDPENPDAEPILWNGRWRSLKPVYDYAFQTGNFVEAWKLSNFGRLLFNTTFIAVTGVIGTLLSSICVAYAFARFPIPGKRFLFMLLISTIIVPPQVVLVPTYAFFYEIGWTGTWLPLIIPHFFSNGYNVFLMRQYFLGLPIELDEAAMIDGAGPFQILIYVIIPQSYPVIVAVALFHLVFAWNDYFLPLIYTLGKPDLQPIAVGIQTFNQRYTAQPHLIQATALLGLIIPVTLFFIAQRFFMQGIVVTGVEK
jgi:multiple sugar transport system permease protein